MKIFNSGKTWQKITACLLGAALCAAPFGGFAAETYFTVKYNAETKAAEITSAGYTASGEAVVVHIAKESENKELSASNLPLLSDIFFAEADGSLNISFSLGENTDSGKYRVYVGTAGQAAALSEQIIIMNENSEATKLALKAVNGAADKTAFKTAVRDGGLALGIDIEAETDLDDMLDVMYGVKTATKGDLSFSDFSKATDFGRAAVALKNGTSLDEVMQKYASAFSAEYSEYQKLDATVKKELEALLSETDFENGFLEYSSLVFVATVRSAADYGTLRDYVTKPENATAFKIDVDGDYTEKLSVNDRSQVFLDLFEIRGNFKTAEDVADAFDKAVKDAVGEEETPSKNNNNNNKKGGSGGGKLSGSMTYEEIPETPQEPDSSESLTGFSDMKGHFAEEAVSKLSAKGIINGFENGTFAPEQSVSRAQLCKMLVLAFGLETNANSSFEDVDSSSWSYPYISILAQKDIVRGDGNAFRPNDSITRQDAAVIIARTLRGMGLLQDGEYTFEDSGDLAAYAAESVSALAANGYLKGDGVNFMPQKEITRGEAAVMLSRLPNVVE